uniref:C3H1-type domain-containing protein n=1 Tax=Panagrellus redivivus TaxID=6233 RepID=A0A7E4ZQH0_PANRE
MCASTSSASSTASNDQEKELCAFYKRIGACRHGAKCSRAHVLPKKSKTVVLRNLYRYAQPHSTQITCNSKESMAIFEEFYEEVFTEIDSAYGTIAQMHVCENMGEHLIGNVYVKFLSYSAANRAVTGLNNRYFARLPIYAELSPVENFHDAVCRQHEAGECTRGGFCNFLHVKQVSLELENRLFDRYYRKRRRKSYSSGSESDYSTTDICDTPHSVSDISDRETMLSDSESNATYIESSEDETDPTVPKAFRLKPLTKNRQTNSDQSDSESETDQRQQISRRIRWQVFRKTLLGESSAPWDDDAEQQYVFSLIE